MEFDEIVGAEVGHYRVYFPDDVQLGIAHNLNRDNIVPILALKLDDNNYLLATETIAMIGEFILQHPELMGMEEDK